MTDWIEYDGHNSPTDTSKDVRWEKRLPDGERATETWFAGKWDTERVVNTWSVAYHLDDPYVPPLPKCWCGAAAVATEGERHWWAVFCDYDADHGEVRGQSEAEARENWRKLRGEA